MGGEGVIGRHPADMLVVSSVEGRELAHLQEPIEGLDRHFASSEGLPRHHHEEAAARWYPYVCVYAHQSHVGAVVFILKREKKLIKQFLKILCNRLYENQ